MSDSMDSLIVQLLDWIGDGRPYHEVMSAWRTSCPRMPVWEEATLARLVEVEPGPNGGTVRVTATGAAALRNRTGA